MRAVCAAILRSALRISGRERSMWAGNPDAIDFGGVGIFRFLESSFSISEGCLPRSAASLLRMTMFCCMSLGISACELMSLPFASWSSSLLDMPFSRSVAIMFLILR